MRKIFSAFFAILLIMTLTACSSPAAPGGTASSEETAAPKTAEPKTIGEALLAAQDSSFHSYSITEDHIKVVTDDYVCEAGLTPELSAKLDAVDFMADDKDEQYAEILSDLACEKVALRSESMLTKDKIASLIGKKGQALLDLSYASYGWKLDEEHAKFYIENNGYSYLLTAEEHFDETEDMDVDALIAECTIKEITDTGF